MRVLLLSAYAAHSHVHWQRALVDMFPRWSWTELALPPRHFSWRVRGNPLYWSLAQRPVLEAGYDVLVATSMVDLATLRGLVPALARLPALLYFHENQFAYPQQPHQRSLLEAQMVSLYSALAADALAFNSAYNRDSFLEGVAALLHKLPDRVPAGVPALLREKAVVLPVPIHLEADAAIPAAWPGASGERPGRPVRLLWSGRFEYDKGGEGLWRLLEQLEQRGLEYELAITGQQFRNSPAIFAQIAGDFRHRLVHFGFVESARDLQALRKGADIVLSTAQHEFQGLAVLEAVACGCLPAVPDRLAYPELYPRRYRYPSRPQEPQKEAAAAAELVLSLAAPEFTDHNGLPDPGLYSGPGLRPHYIRLLEHLAQGAG